MISKKMLAGAVAATVTVPVVAFGASAARAAPVGRPRLGGDPPGRDGAGRPVPHAQVPARWDRGLHDSDR